MVVHLAIFYCLCRSITTNPSLAELLNFSWNWFTRTGQSDSFSAHCSAYSQGGLTDECVTSRRSGCLHLVCVWITGPSRGRELCLALGTPDWRARQEAKHWFLIDTLNSQTDCTTSGHEQNSMHNSKPQASREALSLSVISLSLFLDLFSIPQGCTFVVLSGSAEKQSAHRPAQFME